MTAIFLTKLRLGSTFVVRNIITTSLMYYLSLIIYIYIIYLCLYYSFVSRMQMKPVSSMLSVSNKNDSFFAMPYNINHSYSPVKYSCFFHRVDFRSHI